MVLQFYSMQNCSLFTTTTQIIDSKFSLMLFLMVFQFCFCKTEKKCFPVFQLTVGAGTLKSVWFQKVQYFVVCFQCGLLKSTCQDLKNVANVPKHAFSNNRNTTNNKNTFFIYKKIIVHVSAIGSMFADLAPRLGCWVASHKLYMRMSSGIIGSPVSFFDVTPTGRILARFSKDVDEMDTNLPFLISDGVYCFFEVSIQSAP